MSAGGEARAVAGVARSDRELVAAVIAGDREAFSDLVRRHQPVLFRYARSMGATRETAQDLVQDAFVRAYTRLRQCRDADRFGAWAVAIVRNLLLDHARDVRRTEAPLDCVAHTATVPGCDETRTAVAEALTALPSLLREAFLLRHQHGYSYDEIAEITRSSVSAVKMRVHRAREQLRDALEVHAQ